MSDRCDRCGGTRPDDPEAWDQYLTLGGECPGAVTVSDDGSTLGCGAWTSDAYEAEAYDSWLEVATAPTARDWDDYEFHADR